MAGISSTEFHAFDMASEVSVHAFKEFLGKEHAAVAALVGHAEIEDFR